jgi:hypothetical protein
MGNTMTIRKILPTLVFAALGACETFDAPPEPSLPEANGGLLTDPAAPLLVRFNKPVDPKVLVVKLAKNEVDERQRLSDERGAESTPLDPIYTYTYSEDTGGTSELLDELLQPTSDPNHTFHLRIRVNGTLPISPPLVLIVEPGLTSASGSLPTVARRKTVFSYNVQLTCDKPSKALPAFGSYFFLANVTKPLGTQVRLFAKIRVNPDNGEFSSTFIRAYRNPDPNRCSPPCATTEACRQVGIPTPKCITPSDPADTTDEYPDFIVDTAPATSYQFSPRGCVVDQPDGTAQLTNLPLDIVVKSPAVTLAKTKLTATVLKDTQAVTRLQGVLVADQVLIGGKPSGQGEGDLRGRLIPDAEVPANIPDPP